MAALRTVRRYKVQHNTPLELKEGRQKNLPNWEIGNRALELES
jgi:hypothetical protein